MFGRLFAPASGQPRHANQRMRWLSETQRKQQWFPYLQRPSSGTLLSCLTRCGLTSRSSRAPTACHAGPAGDTRYIFASRARASRRWCRLNSNVRPHNQQLWRAVQNQNSITALLWPHEEQNSPAAGQPKAGPWLKIKPSGFEQRVIDWPLHTELKWTEEPSIIYKEPLMNSCECGCGQESNREFLPGHDQKLRVALEARAGGLLSLRSLVSEAEAYATGASPEAQFLQQVRATFAKARRASGAA